MLLRLRRGLPRFTPEEEKAEIKDPKQYELPDLSLRDFRLLRKSTSISMFKVQLEEYLKKLELSCSVHATLLQLAEKDIQKTRQAIVKRRLSFELGEWSIEDRISKNPNVLWPYKRRMRYYDVDAYDFGIFFRQLKLDRFVDIEISTRKLMLEFPDLMEKYDIRNEYELHNLMKKQGADVLYGDCTKTFG